jgi:hypothetical protein
MSKYKIGKDIGRLLERVKALEQKASRCSCEDGSMDGSERTVRRMTDEEQQQQQPAQTRAPLYCTYMVAGFAGAACPGIAIGDILCISPCPPCPDIARLRVVDAKGRTICVLIVRWAGAGHCSECPPDGLKFIWV